MICKHCGSECPEGTSFCANCGASLKEQALAQAQPAAPQEQPAAPQAQPAAQERPAVNAAPVSAYRPGQALDDGKSFGYAFLCFLFPIIGLILYLVWKDTYPLRASSCGKGAIVGVIVSVVSTIFYVIILFALAGAASAGPSYYGALALAACL